MSSQNTTTDLSSTFFNLMERLIPGFTQITQKADRLRRDSMAYNLHGSDQLSRSCPFDAFAGDLFPGYKAWSERPENKVRKEREQAVRLPHVYAIRNMSDHLTKIGFSTRIMSRLTTLQYATADDLLLMALWEVPGIYVETSLHRSFSTMRDYGEWFKLSQQDEGMLLTYMKPYTRVL